VSWAIDDDRCLIGAPVVVQRSFAPYITPSCLCWIPSGRAARGELAAGSADGSVCLLRPGGEPRYMVVSALPVSSISTDNQARPLLVVRSGPETFAVDPLDAPA